MQKLDSHYKFWRYLCYMTLVATVIFLFNIYGAVADSVSKGSSNTSISKSNGMRLSTSSYPDTQLARSHRERRGRKGNRRRSRSEDTPNETKNSVEPCSACETVDGFVLMSMISDAVRIMVGKSQIVDKSEAVDIQKSRGGIETGLKPDFIGGADCPEIDSEQWAIDYSYKRPWPAIHKGIDIPQPKSTPIRAVADGTVVGKFLNTGNRKGIEVVLRHSPQQTGLSFWTYSQYTHLLAMSPMTIGTSAKMGQEIGKTSNTGKMGRRIRRDALHFAIIYSEHPEWSNDGRFVTPKDGYWMDPNAFYRLTPPYDSKSVKALSEDQKATPVPYVKPDGSFVPQNTKRIWPYPCD